MNIKQRQIAFVTGAISAKAIKLAKGTVNITKDVATNIVLNTVETAKHAKGDFTEAWNQEFRK